MRTGEKKGLLLVNLGTPDNTEVASVRRYLREFLSDPRVVDLPPLGRWLLLNLIILPFRPAKSAEAYRQIWTPEGSPLLVHGRGLAAATAEALGEGWEVALAMRYGNPSIAAGLDALEAAGASEIVLLPLFPQYASSSYGSAVDAVYREAARREVVPPLRVVPPFYDDPGYLEAVAQSVRSLPAAVEADHLLFSFHGVPERHLRRADPTGAHCLASSDCCARPSPAHRGCYRRHCYQSAAGIAARLSLEPGRWSVAFQSRLGRTPWIRPYTDEAIQALAAQGVRRLAVAVPSFVADCLETLEEIGLRADESFRAAGGESLTLVPSLNSAPGWVEAVAALARGRGAAS